MSPCNECPPYCNMAENLTKDIFTDWDIINTEQEHDWILQLSLYFQHYNNEINTSRIIHVMSVPLPNFLCHLISLSSHAQNTKPNLFTTQKLQEVVLMKLIFSSIFTTDELKFMQHYYKCITLQFFHVKICSSLTIWHLYSIWYLT